MGSDSRNACNRGRSFFSVGGVWNNSVPNRDCSVPSVSSIAFTTSLLFTSGCMCVMRFVALNENRKFSQTCAAQFSNLAAFGRAKNVLLISTVRNRSA